MDDVYLVGVAGLGHVPRPRNFIHESLAFRRRFPCKLPLAVLAYDSLREVADSTRYITTILKTTRRWFIKWSSK